MVELEMTSARNGSAAKINIDSSYTIDDEDDDDDYDNDGVLPAGGASIHGSSSHDGLVVVSSPVSASSSETPHGHLGGSGNNSSGRIGPLVLAVLVFYNVSGGPFGVEETVRAGGNFYTLLGFFLGPILWSIPEAIMATELGCAFPEPAGGVAWVEVAFGETAGWFAGFLGWVGGATDNAIYPVLFLDYIIVVMFPDWNTDEFTKSWTRFSIISVTAVFLGYVNWLGLTVVGRISIIICCIAMSPFVLASIIGAFQIDPANWFLQRTGTDEVEDAAATGGGFFPHATWGGILWRPFLNSLFWNLNSFDAAACFAHEIDDLPRVFPQGMGWGAFLVSIGYFIPLLVMLGASRAQSHQWVDGYLATVATEIAGPWLGGWTVFAAGLSNLALFEAELSADSYQIMGMAERGHIPPIFKQRSRHGTPTYGIMLGLAVIIVLAGVSNLDQLIELLNFNYALAVLMEYCAFIRLRFARDDIPRPWKLPLNKYGCAAYFFPTIALTVLTLSLATYTTLLFSLCVNITGTILFFARRFWREDTTTYAPVVTNGGNIEATAMNGKAHHIHVT